MSEASFVLPIGKTALLNYLGRLPAEKKWRVTVTPFKRTRSDQQNRYLWGVAYKTLAEKTGQPADDWHEYMLGEMHGWDEYELFGKRKIRPRKRSSKMSTMEFMDFVEFIQVRAAENNIYIPDPNEQDL